MSRLQRPRLGNDVVDLKASCAIGKSRDERFMNRVFTDEERQCIRSAEEPDFVLWAIWAAKESAFKAVQKGDPDLIFAHRQFALDIGTLDKLLRVGDGVPFTGKLRLGELELQSRWSSGLGWIHCVAVGPAADRASASIVSEVRDVWQIHDLGRNLLLDIEELKSTHSLASRTVRALGKKLIKEQFSEQLGADQEVRIIRPDRGEGKFAHPRGVDSEGAELDCELSLSHDGRWIAAAVFWL